MFRALKRIANLSLAIKLAVLILASAATIFVAAFSYNYVMSERLLLRNVEDNTENLAQSIVNRIEKVLCGVEMGPLYLARILETQDISAKELEGLIDDLVKSNPSIFGSTVAFEPFGFSPGERYYAPYVYRDGDEFPLKYLGSDQYQYHYWDWYLIPKELDRPLWSEPYYDEGGGGVTMSTYSVPFYRTVDGERKFAGVVTADVSLQWLVDLVRSVTLYQSGYAFLLSQNGVFLTHPNPEYVMRESVFSAAEATNNPEWRDAGKNMIRGGAAFRPIHSAYLGKPSWLYYAPLPSVGWSIGILFPEEELFADNRNLAHQIVLIAVTGFALLLLTIILVISNVTRPLRVLSRKTAEIAKGNFDIELPAPRNRDEVGELTTVMSDMLVSLKDYFATIKARERLESELKIARSIQRSFLPKKFPSFEERTDFRLHAVLEPAKAVGGDLYDFFLMDEDHLFFSIGDVSDKGVPAALFMAVTKTLMKGIAEQGLEPSEILAKVNEELCQENEEMMFVTLFCGILDLRSGDLRYSNAGHNPPLIVRKGGGVEWMDLPDGLVLGAMPDVTYATRAIVLEPGDVILGYTDGVTEAMNPANELYSEKRLLDTVRRLRNLTPEPLVDQLLETVREFAGGAAQSDDITILAMSFGGRASDLPTAARDRTPSYRKLEEDES